MLYLYLVPIAIILLGVIVKIYVKFLTTKWCKSQTCLVGKTSIVTGANTGIGYETAVDFAKRGSRVILACRNEARGEEARAKIVERTGNENVEVRLVDLGSFKSVRAFAKNINETEDRLDILVNNAAAGGFGEEKSEDGYFLEMQINYFSPFLLTNLLIGLLKKTKGSRVVNVTSEAAKYVSFDVNNVDSYPGFFLLYPKSKLYNILFTIELAQKLAGTDVTTYSVHPGAVSTDFLRRILGVFGLLNKFILNLLYKTCEEGAQSVIYCSVEKGIEAYNGDLFDRCRRIEMYKSAADPGHPKKLWEVTERIVELKPEENLF